MGRKRQHWQFIAALTMRYLNLDLAPLKMSESAYVILATVCTVDPQIVGQRVPAIHRSNWPNWTASLLCRPCRLLHTGVVSAPYHQCCSRRLYALDFLSCLDHLVDYFYFSSYLDYLAGHFYFTWHYALEQVRSLSRSEQSHLSSFIVTNSPSVCICVYVCT